MATEMSGQPTVLFKYFAPGRVDTLRNLELSFSPLSSFNDPFEGRPEITGLTSQDMWRETLIEKFGPAIKEQYSKLPNSQKAAIPFNKFEESMWALARTNLDSELSKYIPAIDQLVTTLPDHLDKQIGVLCLCEVPDNLLMWAHYSQSHTGFVVEYDTSHAFFNAKRSEKDEFYHLRRILYRSTRPSAKLIDMQGPELFLVKSDHWSYEHEWRILKPLADSDRKLELPDRTVHLFNYPAEIIRSVTVGARSSEQIISTIREILRTNNLGSVKLYQAYPDSSHFLVRTRGLAI